MFSGSGAGTFGHRIVLTRANPPAKPKTVKRLEVVDFDGWLQAGRRDIDTWPSRADFRGFVFVLPDTREVVGKCETLLWGSPDEPSHFDNERTSFYSHPIRPSFVEVAR